MSRLNAEGLGDSDLVDGAASDTYCQLLFMAVATKASSGKSAVSIRIEDLIPFEPINLGPCWVELRATFREVSGKRQSEIARLTRRRARAAADGAATISEAALALCLHVLSDYVAAGYYPLISGEQCLLAPTAHGSGATDSARRDALRRSYEMARLQVLESKGKRDGLEADADWLINSGYSPRAIASQMASEPPSIELVDASSSSEARTVWRAVRNTWSLPDTNAPGREVSLVAVPEGEPHTPIGILQFRNVVPEIRCRDQWMGITSAGYQDGRGYLSQIAARGAIGDHVAATEAVLRSLLDHVRLPAKTKDLGIERLQGLAAAERQAFNAKRKSGDSSGARKHLATSKRADTAADLLRGISGLSDIGDRPLAEISSDRSACSLIDAGLRKIWHYHMGFAAIEVSICGAAPPFGPMRTGKLMAGLAGCDEAISRWGDDRPLGAIASTVYAEDVRSDVPNPGPIVEFTSGLYPGHSAQYTRARSGDSKWIKIGDTAGFGTFHISPETVESAYVFNELSDGYRHVGNRFGEGASPRFRALGRAISRLGLPDLRKHENRRPVYALPLVDDVPGALLGWAKADRAHRPTPREVSDTWWNRWVASTGQDLAARTRQVPDLTDTLGAIARQLGLDAV